MSNNGPDLFALHNEALRALLLAAGWQEGDGPTAGRWREPGPRGSWLPAHEAAARVKIIREDDGEIE
jgi:hypothetical protein